MFELNEAIARWRRRMQAGGLRRAAVLDELESHLLEEMDRLVAAGESEEEAFAEAEGRMGDPGELNDEFRKIRGERGGLLALIGGEIMELRENPGFERAVKGSLRVLVGLALLTALIGVFFTWKSITISGERPYPSRMPTPWHVVFGTVSLALVLLCAIFKRKWKAPIMPGRVTSSLVLSCFILLIPFYLIIMAGWLLNAVPLAQRLVLPLKIVQSAASPNGSFEAYVVDRPSIDPPDQHAYLRRAGEKRGREVGGLGVSRIERIQWSPDGALAVFHTPGFLIVARAPDFKSRTLSLGTFESWNRGTFAIDSRNARALTAIDFPRPGVLTYRYTSRKTGAQGSETVDMNDIQ